MHVDERLERLAVEAVVLVGMPAAGRDGAVERVDRPRAHERAPQRRRGERRALGVGGDPVAGLRRLAGEEELPAGAQHPPELGERAVEVGDVVQDRMAEHEVEGVVVERQVLGIAGDGLDGDADALRVGLQRVEHAGRDVGRDGLADDAVLQHVQREVARAGADLQRAAERRQRRAEQLVQLAADLVSADLAVVDAPLRVVVLGRRVVVARVDVADRLRAGGSSHAAASLLTAWRANRAARQPLVRSRSRPGCRSRP